MAIANETLCAQSWVHFLWKIILFGAILPSITAFCPEKCICQDDTVSCINMNSSEVHQLFLPEGPFLSAYIHTIQKFSLRASQLSNLSAIASAGFQKLLMLDVSQNMLQTLDIDNPVVTLPSVTHLNLSSNKLAPVISRQSFAMFPNIEEIQADNNGIFTVDWEAFRLLRLKRLYLSHNYLATISEHMLRFTPNLELLDLSHNQITVAQSSSFFAAQHLRTLDLSHNRIQKFFYDSFTPLFQLEFLDFSYNNLSEVPIDMKQFIALRALNLSGNPLERVTASEIVQPALQVLNISNCPRLKLIESRAFSKLPNLQTAILRSNPMLNFISPSAFENISSLFELDVSRNNLITLDESVIRNPIRTHIAENPFSCPCISPFVSKYREHIVDYKTVTCLTENSTLKVFIDHYEETGNDCSTEPITPLGIELITEIGSFYSLYCAARVSNRNIKWTLSNKTQIIGVKNQKPIDNPNNFRNPSMTFSSSQVFSDLFPGQLTNLHPHYHSQHSEQQPIRPRVIATNEQLRFEIVMAEDEGEYSCKIETPNTGSYNNYQLSNTKFIQLRVLRPNIALEALEIGSHYIAVAWNGSLSIKAPDRVSVSLDVRDGDSGSVSRVIQLSPYNPWHSYNVMRLRPETNYTFCLVYRLVDSTPSQARSIDQLPRIYESCVRVRTTTMLGFWDSISATTVFTILVMASCLSCLCCFRSLYARFFIWHETKLRARMNQSTSGQSFLSSSNTNGAISMSQSITFENHRAVTQPLSQSTSMTKFANELHAINAVCSGGRSVTIDDAF
ncbi:leucine rich repeat domain-containing protein [Ditylenchus destructor]|uniref:Leucine rich repeat domain-containing protein n=1 Tax=Ditylenchus destructor TaxID=166010 RepID=A0AAD4RC40_9BILA|nr:leucine rich repeat domain-containing protein [Ditylenchus destructor]